ncbi:MAG: hypothetical protein AAGA83_07440 [Cyanobacteria bacterium P01_F01_bin.116]
MIGWFLWEIRATYADYDQVKACLEQYQFEIIDEWQHEDMILEDFGWQFRTSDGKTIAIEIYDGDSPRDCYHRAAGVRVSKKSSVWPEPGSFSEPFSFYLSFDNPDLIAALGGKRLKNMDDMFANLDELLTWKEQNPDHVLCSLKDQKNSSRYLNLIILPDQ